MRALLAILLVVGCARTEDEPAKGPPKMKTAEMQRALEMCERWVERVCRCAEKDGSLRKACDLAKAQPEGAKMHISLLEGVRGPLNDEERRISEGNVRDFLQACVDDDLALDVARCPRAVAE